MENAGPACVDKIAAKPLERQSDQGKRETTKDEGD